MSPWIYLVIVVLLAVALDVGLILWMRRDLRKDGIDKAQQKSAIYFAGRYSPLFTWVKLRWQAWQTERQARRVMTASLKELSEISESRQAAAEGGAQDETELLKQRVAELEQQVAALQSELGRARGRPQIDWRAKLKPLTFLVAVFFLAALSPFLVFRHRWLELSNDDLPLREQWLQIKFLHDTALPSYFAIIFISMAVLLILILLRWEQAPVFEKEFPVALPTDWPKPARYEKLSRFLLIGAGLGAVGTFIAGLLCQGKVFGWGFFLALILYIAGWALREVSLDTFWAFWKENWEVAAACLFAHISLILFLQNAASQQMFPWMYAVLLALSLVNLARFFRRIPPILWVVNLALILYTLNINHWAFSVIGDEYSFYTRGAEVAERWNFVTVVSHLFDGRWVYGAHPYLSTLLQAISMKLLGGDSFGWRFSSIYLTAWSIGLFYLFYKAFVPRMMALLAALFLAFSAYIMAFGKIGYNNLQALFAMSLVMAAAAWAVKSKQRLAFVGVGLSMGFCFYVYPAALYVIVVAVLLLLFYFPPRSRHARLAWGIMAVSLFIAILPLLLQPDYWQAKLPGLWVNNPAISSTSLGYHTASNFLLALFSFLYTVEETHFVVGSYIDPVTAGFVLLGLVLAIKWARQKRFIAFLLVSFVVLLLLVGASHDRRFPPTTRMFLMLPWFTLLAAIGLTWFAEQVKALQISFLSKPYLLILLMVGVMGLNLYQAYVLSKWRSTSYNSMDMLFARIIEERLPELGLTLLPPKTFLFITDKDWGIDGQYLYQRVYPYSAYRVYLQRVVVDSPTLPASALDLIAKRDTLVILHPKLDSQWQSAIGSYLEKAGKVACPVRDFRNETVRFTLWHSAELSKVCPNSP